MMCHLKRGLFFFFYILMKCSVVPVSALDSALPWQSPCVHSVLCWEHQNQTQKWGKDWVYSLFIFHEIKLLKIEKKKSDLLKKFSLPFLWCITLCMVVMALAFCRLLAHLLIQRVKKTKQAHPDLISYDRDKKKINK